MTLRTAFNVLFAKVLINRWFFSFEGAGVIMGKNQRALPAADRLFMRQWWEAQQMAWREEGEEQASSAGLFQRRESTDIVPAPSVKPQSKGTDRPLGEHSLEMAWGYLDWAYAKKGRKWDQNIHLFRFGPLADSILWFF